MICQSFSINLIINQLLVICNSAYRKRFVNPFSINSIINQLLIVCNSDSRKRLSVFSIINNL